MVDRVKLGMKNICPLCFSKAKPFYEEKHHLPQRYYRCGVCDAVFVDSDDFVDTLREQKVYENHNIDTSDEGYRNFVSPLVNAIKRDFSPEHEGLDFGAGRSQIVSVMLAQKGYTIKNYDPFFADDTTLLEKKYDFISACEVVEHFHSPKKEFTHLHGMLKNGGKLYLMTDVYMEQDFAQWYYKNDPTHVFFYTPKTFEWIRKEFGFTSVVITNNRLIVLG